MINLLPDPAKHSLRMAYYERLAIVFCILAACAVFAGAALLAPSYFLARADANAAQNYLVASSQALTGGGTAGATQTLAQLSEQISLMKSYPRAPHVAEILSQVTNHLPVGVFLTRISVTPGSSGPDTISVSGVAQTRDELLAFADALKSLPAFSGVSVPLSQLAGETNVTFSLSFTSSQP